MTNYPLDDAHKWVRAWQEMLFKRHRYEKRGATLEEWHLLETALKAHDCYYGAAIARQMALRQKGHDHEAQ